MDPIPLANLRPMGRNIREHLEDGRTLEKLFETAEHGRLPTDHRAAACNTLCAFVIQGSKSNTLLDVRKICAGLPAWQRLLDLYLDRMQDPQSKPMKQVLDTLHALLVAPGLEAQGAAKRQAAVIKCLDLIYTQDGIPHIRPAMQVLQHFLSKNGLSVLELLHYQPSLSDNQSFVLNDAVLPENNHLLSSDFQAHHVWIAQASQADLQTLDSDIRPPPEKRSSRPDGRVDSSSQVSTSDNEATIGQSAIRSMLSNVLRWAQYRDIAPIAGKLLGSIIQSIKSNGTSGHEPPVWTSLVLDFVREDPKRLDMLERYVLPELLRISTDDTTSFLRCISFVELTQGHIFRVSEIEARLCLLAIKVSLKNKLEIHTGTDSSRCLSREADLKLW